MTGAFVARVNPLLALDAGETDQIATAVVNVAKHYDIPVNPVTQAWIGLAGTIGAIYTGKIMAIRMSRG
jgi:hypothetical protein